MTVSVHGRRTARGENGNVVPIADRIVVTELQGMAEVEPGDLGVSPYVRRLDRDGRALGGAAEGQSLGARWVAWWEEEREAESQSSAQVQNPPSDRWQGTGPRAGFVVQRGIFDQAILLTLGGTMQRVTTEARRSDLTGIIVRGTASDWNTRLGAVWQPAGAPWAAFAQGELGRSRRFTHDAVAELTDERASWQWGGGAGASYRVSRRVAVRAGAAATLYTPSATIPAEDSLGTVYRSYIAPEVEYYATQALGVAAEGRVSWQRANYRLYLRTGVESLSARLAGYAGAFTPSGARRMVTVSVGAER